MTDRTHELVAAFNRVRQSRVQPTTTALQTSPTKTSLATLPSVVAPFLDALSQITIGSHQLELQTDQAVQAAMVTMDHVIQGSLSDIESQVRAAIAGGVTLTATVAQYIESVEAALAVERQVAKNARLARAVKDEESHHSETGDSMLSRVRGIAGAAERWLLPTSSSSKAIPPTPCLEALEHCLVAGQILQCWVVEEKLRLALCEEEVELYGKDLFVLARAGVIVGPSSAAVPIPHAASSATHGRSHALRQDDALHSTEIKAHKGPRMVREGLTKGKAGAQRVATSLASLTSRLGAAVARNPSSSSHETEERHQQDIMGRRRFYEEPTLRVNPEEEVALQREATQLRQQLTETSAKAAREVESSIRELSHLTSLLNEQALIQAEQLAVATKNTEDAFTNVTKASAELQKPKSAASKFLNPTRQLIALIWSAIIVLLIAHFVIR